MTTNTKVQVTNPIHWNPETEVCLFYAMRGYKPVGINKHLHMMCIHKKFSTQLGQTIKSEQIWDHLKTMYKLKELDHSEGIPFNNKKTEFHLPSSYFSFSSKTDKDSSLIPPLPVEQEPVSTPKSKAGRKRGRVSNAASNPGSPATFPAKRKR